MRIAAALAASLIAMPLAAQDLPDRDAADMAAQLGNPAVQDGIARAVQAMAGVVLDTRIGPLARLAGRDADLRPNDTLRDVQRRDDPWFEERLYADTRRGTAAAGAVAGDVAAMLPELARTAARLRGTLGGLGAIGGASPVDEGYADDAPFPDDY